MALPGLDLSYVEIPYTEPHRFDPTNAYWWLSDETSRIRNIKKWYGTEWARVVQKSLGLHDPGHEWRGVKPLGKGGQGLAVLYERINPVTGEHVVLKEEEDTVYDLTRGIPNEVAVMAQANALNNPNIVQLRSFKYYRSWEGPRKRRLYLEYCPHGDLADLRSRYKHFGQFFPELFLWTAFRDLAQALLAFRCGPWTDLMSPTLKGDHQLVHFDIKAGNVFLGDKDKRDGKPLLKGDYPVLKMGDFGLAKITSRSDPRNPRVYIGGTSFLRPPEQEDEVKDTLRLWWPVNRARPWHADPPEPLLESHNIFAVGEVMWEFLTQEHFYLPLVFHRDLPVLPDGHIVPPIHTMRGSDRRPGKKMNETLRDPGEYSEALRDLVRDCLHPDPAQRPTAAQLLGRVRDGLQECRLREGESGDPANKVFFRGNEINDMEPGVLFWPLFDHYDEILDPAGQEVYKSVKRGGWIDDMTERAKMFTKHHRKDRKGRYFDYRGDIDEPIIFPKLRWFPDKHEFWLMKRSIRGQVPPENSQPPEIMYSMYEDIFDGEVAVQRKDLRFVPKNREKNVWIGDYRELGTLRREIKEIKRHRPGTMGFNQAAADDDDEEDEDDYYSNNRRELLSSNTTTAEGCRRCGNPAHATRDCRLNSYDAAEAWDIRDSLEDRKRLEEIHQELNAEDADDQPSEVVALVSNAEVCSKCHDPAHVTAECALDNFNAQVLRSRRLCQRYEEEMDPRQGNNGVCEKCRDPAHEAADCPFDDFTAYIRSSRKLRQRCEEEMDQLEEALAGFDDEVVNPNTFPWQTSSDQDDSRTIVDMTTRKRPRSPVRAAREQRFKRARS